jgi:HEPN domain-containing protein
MPERHADWLRQAERDLAHAQRAAADKDYEWSCFAAQQAAEKAVKALYRKLGAAAWGHSVTMLLANLPQVHRPPEPLVERAKALDKHYVVARDPSMFDQGAPFQYHTRTEADQSVADARAIARFCRDAAADEFACLEEGIQSWDPSSKSSM